MTKRVGDYDLGAILGEGAFGTVRQATHTQFKQTFAIKIIDKDKVKREDLIESLKKEIQILMMIDHPNVVKLTEVLASKTKIYLVLEWVKGGELFEKIRQQGFITESKMRQYFRQIVRALLYCQSKSIAHRDLKPENILITEEDQIKVSDFGLSSLYKDPNSFNNILYTTCGTINYLAPEVIQSTGYDGHKADIWSLGVILYFACSGYLPFEDDNVAHLLERIVRSEYTEFPKSFSKNLKDLLANILVCNPYKRISLSKITEHPWFLEDIKQEDIKLFEEDKQRFRLEEQFISFNNTNQELNFDQNFTAIKTTDWKIPFLNELIIVRKMGAIEFFTFLQGKIIQNITQIQPKSKKSPTQIDESLPQYFTSRKSLQTLCQILSEACESQSPQSRQQLNPQKTLMMSYNYKIQKEIVELSWEVFEIMDDLVLIDFELRSGKQCTYQQIFNKLRDRLQGLKN